MKGSHLQAMPGNQPLCAVCKMNPSFAKLRLCTICSGCTVTTLLVGLLYSLGFIGPAIIILLVASLFMPFLYWALRDERLLKADKKHRFDRSNELFQECQIESHYDPDTLFALMHDYFAEKTWGLEALRWQIIIADKITRKLVVEIRFDECKDKGQPISRTTAIVPLNDSFIAISSTGAPTPIEKQRYAQLKIVIAPDEEKSIGALAWQFRYTEAFGESIDRQLLSHEQPIPEKLLVIAEEFRKTFGS